MTQLKLTATLTDLDGNPLPNKTINFYYSRDAVTWTPLDTKTTDSNGQAETIFSTNETGTFYFKAEFPGDDQYEPSSAVASYTITPTAAKGIPTWMIVLIVLFVLILLFGLGGKKR